MKKKLTIYVDEKVIEKAKLHAVIQKTSVSEIVDRLLSDFLEEKGKKRTKPTKK